MRRDPDISKLLEGLAAEQASLSKAHDVNPSPGKDLSSTRLDTAPASGLSYRDIESLQNAGKMRRTVWLLFRFDPFGTVEAPAFVDVYDSQEAIKRAHSEVHEIFESSEDNLAWRDRSGLVYSAKRYEVKE